MQFPDIHAVELWNRIWLRFVDLLRVQATNARQGMGALLVASGTNVFAGLTLGFMTGTLERLPGLIILVPAAIGMRGNIFGALGSRLGTAMHTGQFTTPITRRSAPGQGVAAALVMTLYISIALAVLAKETARLFGLETISMLDYLVISFVGGILSSAVVLLITIRVAMVSVRRGWDMDNVAAPLVTAAGDLVTLPALWLATLLLPIAFIKEVLGIISLGAVIGVTVYSLMRLRGLSVYRGIIRQSIPILLLAGLLDIIAGITIDRRVDRFFTYPALLVLIPPFLADAGAIGGILSARLSSKLHLGLVDPKALPGRRSLEDISLAYVLAIPVFLLVGVGATLVSSITGLAHPPWMSMIALSVLAGAMSTTAAVFVAYYASVLSYRFGLDPDNYGIPTVTSTMDMTGVLALFLAMVILGIV